MGLRRIVTRVLEKVFGPEKTVSEILKREAGVPPKLTRLYIGAPKEGEALRIREEIAKNHHLTLRQQSLLEEARGMVQQAKVF